MRKAATTKATPRSKATQATPANDAIVVRIPKLNLSHFRFSASSLTLYLGALLVIFAFLLGMLTNKVMFLEKQFKEVSNAAVATAPAAAPTDVPPPQYEKVTNGHLPVRGDDKAKVTIVEFSDFQCPFCEKYFTDTDGQIQDQYVKTGKVKFVYRHFPLSSIHPNAQKAAEAAECANEQNQFWNFHDQLFQNQSDWADLSASEAENAWVGYAGQLGMDTDQFKSCIDTDKYKTNVDKDTADGDAAHVDGTPAFFINGYRLTGAQPFSEFKTVIDEQLKK